MDNQNPDTLTPPETIQPTQESTLPTTEKSQQDVPKKKKYWLLMFLVVLLLGATGVFSLRYYKEKHQLDSPKSNLLPSTQTDVSSSMPSEIYPLSYSFCKGLDYCSMNEVCSDVPTSHGVCSSDEDCNNQYLCGRKETLMNGVMEVMFLDWENKFLEDVLSDEGKTRIGYILVRNIENSRQNVDIANFECLNYEGLCEDINVVYPPSFQINKRDVVIFPVYVENHNNLKGLVSLEFSFQIGEKSSMISVDLIFNTGKTCIYQWGSLEKSRRIYFNEPSKVDWTQHCQ